MSSDRSDPLPLAGWRVLVTRPTEQAAPLLEALRAAGAIALPYPTITVAPPPSWGPFDAAIARIDSYAWVVFTSPSAVRFAFTQAPDLPTRLRSASLPRVAAVGEETARSLRAHTVPVAVVPTDQRQEGLVQAMGTLPPGTRVLFPQALGGRELLRDQLVRAGSTVDVVAVSRTVPLSLHSPPPPFDAVIFASPSALHAFVARWTVTALRDKVVAAMGPTTRQAAVSAGAPVQVMPASPSVPALVAALCVHRRTP